MTNEVRGGSSHAEKTQRSAALDVGGGVGGKPLHLPLCMRLPSPPRQISDEQSECRARPDHQTPPSALHHATNDNSPGIHWRSVLCVLSHVLLTPGLEGGPAITHISQTREPRLSDVRSHGPKSDSNVHGHSTPPVIHSLTNGL